MSKKLSRTRVAKDRQLVPLTNYGTFRSNVYRFLRRPYMFAAMCGYALVILFVLFYLSQPLKYRSEMDLVLPGTGNSSNVSLDQVGQVSSQTSTPFSGGGFNPRVNYKEMLTSRSVLSQAAEQMNVSLAKFGEPKVKLTEQTSILSVSITGASPKQAQQKAWELYEALQNGLDLLRADEVARRDESIKNVLQGYREQMNIARNNIVDFQQRSLLVTPEQLDMLVSTHSEKSSKNLTIRAEIADTSHYVTQLSIDIGLSPQLAGKALKLGSDAEYRGYISEMDESAARLTEFQSRWGKKHPKVVAEKLRFDASKAQVWERARMLVGPKADELFGALTLENNPKQAQLFADLINAFAKEQGLIAKQVELERAVVHLADQLKVYSREHAELDRLQREYDLAEAVFTSAAARLEASKADVFASYPVVQLLTTPSFATMAASPRPIIAAVAAVAGFLFITLGVIVLWQRNNLINLMLKRS